MTQAFTLHWNQEQIKEMEKAGMYFYRVLQWAVERISLHSNISCCCLLTKSVLCKNWHEKLCEEHKMFWWCQPHCFWHISKTTLWYQQQESWSVISFNVLKDLTIHYVIVQALLQRRYPGTMSTPILQKTKAKVRSQAAFSQYFSLQV